MGNNLCAPLLKKGYRTSELPYLNKDSHLLRLWAEIFRVHGDGDYMRWERVSDDVVPVNIICIQASPSTVFQITAYNRHVEKIFNAKLVQPGTIICPATECFVHWRDTFRQCEWGLNFSCAADAKKFRECCTTASHKYSRKASSASSLRLSPPTQRHENNSSKSSPSSPLVQQRDAQDRPGQKQQRVSCDMSNASSSSNRTPQRTTTECSHSQIITADVNPRKPSSTSSCYDNVNTAVVKRVAFAEKHESHSFDGISPSHISPGKVTLINGAPDANNGYNTYPGTDNHRVKCTNQKPCKTDTDNDAVFTDQPDSVSLQSYTLAQNFPGKNSRLTVDPQRHSTNSSDSPEWPAPPEPLTPQTPLNPCHIDFDSDTLMRLLRCLPADSRSNIFADCEGSEMSFNAKTFSETQLLENGNGEVIEQIIQREASLSGRVEAGGSEGGAMVMDNATLRGIATLKATENNQKITPMKLRPLPPSVQTLQCVPSIQQSMEALNRIEEMPDAHQYVKEELSDEEVEADSDHGVHTGDTSGTSAPAMTGANRKAGWLVVKNWLVPKKRRLELAPRRSWHKYWVCLKGVSLLFYDRDEGDMLKYNLVIDGGLAQSIPEHPKRSNVFSLSSAFGYAYLFQAGSMTEVNHWIDSIHSACASSFARQHGKDNTLILLKAGLRNLEANINMEKRMMKMAELQLSIVSEPKSCQAIVNQINQWYENLEHMNVDHFRLRCYASSLQSVELPNPKVLLGSISRLSKSHLGRLGVFTVASFHALVCARSPKPAAPFQKPIKLKSNAATAAKCTTADSTKIVANSRPLSQPSGQYMLGQSTAGPTTTECLSRVGLPDGQTVTVCVDSTTTVHDLLHCVCNKRQLNPKDHFVKFKVRGSGTLIPNKNSLISKQMFDSIEVSKKSIYQMDLCKSPAQHHFGFFIEAELEQDSEREDELCVYICDIQRGSIADNKGLVVGDEILMINRKVVSDLDMVYVENLLHSCRDASLMIRSCRTHRPYSTFMTEHDDQFLSDLVCQPPPSQPCISHQQITDLIVPNPNISSTPDAQKHCTPIAKTQPSPKREPSPNTPGGQINDLLQVSEHVTEMCRTQPVLTPNSGSPTSALPLSDADKLRKSIIELLDTERTYVRDMNCLIERYLEPLKDESFMTTGEIHHLFGNIREIVSFQQHFLQSLEDAVKTQPKFAMTNDITEFKDILYLLGTSFLYYANHFKVYSSFCASHSRSQKILDPERNSMLREFLRARNPKQQHSSTLESLLIKPIQRIVKYPMLLQQLCNMTNRNTHEHCQLVEALRGMEAVAEHINEMQKIYDEYGSTFDELAKVYQQTHPHNVPTDLSVGELQMYGTVEWINAGDTVGKMKKATQLDNILFVFRLAVVFLCREHVKRKKTKTGNNNRLDANVSVHRYQSLIPVHELKVRYTSMCESDTRHWWDLVHLRSESAGRPEKVYNFCNNTIEAKSDFLRIIRQIIRDSMRRVPNSRPTNEVTFAPIIPPEPKQLPPLDYELATQAFSENESNDDSNSYTTTSEGQTLCSTSSQSQSSSNSNISGSSHSDPARLIQSSARPPVQHCLHVLRDNQNSASPIWRLRDNENRILSHSGVTDPTQPSRGGVFQASAYGDCAEIVYRNDNVLVMSEAQNIGSIEQFKDDDTL